MRNWIKKQISKIKSDKVPSHIEEFFVAGHRFRVITQYGSNLFSRNQAFQQAVRMLERNMTNDDLIDICKIGIEANNQGDASAVGSVFNTIDALATADTSTNMLTLIGNTFILIDGEQEEKMEEEFRLKKLDLIEKSDEIKAFFFSIVDVILLQGAYLSTPIQIDDYMKGGKQQQLEKHTSTMMQRIEYSQGLTTN